MAPAGTSSGSYNHVYSTGQTMADLAGMIQILSSVPKTSSSGNSSSDIQLPPAFTNPNYKPHDLGKAQFTEFFVPTIVAAIFFAIRLYVRIDFRLGSKYAGNLLPEDWVLALGFIGTAVNCVIMSIGTLCWQFGMKPYDMTIKNIQHGLIVSYSFLIIYLCSIGLIRFSLILFIKRLYARVSKVMRRLCDAMMVLTILLAIASSLVFAFQCKPFHAAFNIFEKVKAKCIGSNPYLIVSCLNIIADFAVAFLPMNLVWRMVALPLKKRIEVIIMFSLGLLACTAAIVRFAFLRQTVLANTTAYRGNGKTMQTALCCQYELCIAIITACIPQVKIFIHKFTKSRSSTEITQSRPTNERSNGPSSRSNGHSRILTRDTASTSTGLAVDEKTYNTATTTTTLVEKAHLSTNTLSSVSTASVDYWSEDALLAHREQQKCMFELPIRGRTRSEEAEDIYSRLPSALPKSVPPWMDEKELNTKDILMMDITKPPRRTLIPANLSAPTVSSAPVHVTDSIDSKLSKNDDITSMV